MCSKYHACHTKSRLNSTPRSLDVLFTLRKAIQRKLHVLKVPRLSHKVTIQHFSKARFHRKTQSTAPPQHAPARENRRFTTVSRDRHARSYERVARAPAPKSTFYYSFARSTHTIPCKTQGFASIFRTRAALKKHYALLSNVM